MNEFLNLKSMTMFGAAEALMILANSICLVFPNFLFRYGSIDRGHCLESSLIAGQCRAMIPK